MPLQDHIDLAGRNRNIPFAGDDVRDSGSVDVEKLASLMEKQASIIEGSEDQDVATQHTLAAIMDDGMTGDKARKIQAIRDALQEMEVIQ